MSERPFHVMDPRSRFNPRWWYVCWFGSVGLNLVVFLQFIGWYVGVLPRHQTYWFSVIAWLLLTPAMIYSTRRLWASGASIRANAAKIQAEHYADVMGHCVGCHEDWPCSFVDIALLQEKLGKPSRTERLVRRFR